MNTAGIFASFIAALLLTMTFANSYRSRGPIGGLGIFFLIIFLASWAGQLWIAPIGPKFLGVAWVPLFFISLLSAMLLMAASSPLPKNFSKTRVSEMEKVSATALGIFFWIALLFFLFSILLGYYFAPHPLIFSKL